MKLLKYILLILVAVSVSFFLFMSHKQVSNHRYVSEFLKYQISQYVTFYRSYPLNSNDITKVHQVKTFWHRNNSQLDWDSSRIKPYLKSIKLIYTPKRLIVYYDINSKGIINLSNLNFLNQWLRDNNVKYFEIEKTAYTRPDQRMVFDVILINNYQMITGGRFQTFYKDLENFHKNYLNYNDSFRKNTDAYLQIRLYNGRMLYDVIYRKENVSNEQIHKAYRLLKQNMLEKYQGEFEVMNVPLVIGNLP